MSPPPNVSAPPMDPAATVATPSDAAVNWGHLPAELKRLIFTEVEHAGRKLGGTEALAPLATVDAEWREAVEKMLFKALTVEVADVFMFEKVFAGSPRRQAALRFLCLDIQLPRYPQRLNRTNETIQEQDANDTIFTETLWHLMKALSLWDGEALGRDYKSPGLSLEFVARSPSDRAAFFGEDGFAENGASRFFESQLDLHLGSMPEPMGRLGLPEVTAVTSLCLPRQNHRFIAARPILHLLLSMPRLRHVDLQICHQFSDEAQREVDRDFAVHIPFWPESFQRLTIFRHNDVFNTDPGVWGTDTKLPFLAQGLRDHSQHLEELAVSNFVDADHFFEPFYLPRRRLQLPAWENMRLFSMTSTSICSSRDENAIYKMLLAAALAARRMPVLEIMELYNAEPYEGALFRYRATHLPATIGWVGSWEYPIPADLQKAWELTAAASYRRLGLQLLPFREQRIYAGPVHFVQMHVTARFAPARPTTASETPVVAGRDASSHLPADRLRLAPATNHRARAIEAAEAKRDFWARELARLESLDEDAAEQDRRDGSYDHVFPWGGVPMQYRASLGSRRAKVAVEVVYENNGQDLGDLPDAEDEDAWETE